MVVRVCKEILSILTCYVWLLEHVKKILSVLTYYVGLSEHAC